jgi:hypothetical protein
MKRRSPKEVADHAAHAAGWDEAKHPRVPKGSGESSGEFTSGSEGITKTTVNNEIKRIVRRGNYAHYGVRVDNYLPKVGDTAPMSYDWSLSDHPKALNGTAAIEIPKSNIDAWKRTINYSGSHLVLLGSREASHGTDRGEIVMSDAVVLARWPLHREFW